MQRLGQEASFALLHRAYQVRLFYKLCNCIRIYCAIGWIFTLIGHCFIGGRYSIQAVKKAKNSKVDKCVYSSRLYITFKGFLNVAFDIGRESKPIAWISLLLFVLVRLAKHLIMFHQLYTACSRYITTAHQAFSLVKLKGLLISRVIFFSLPESKGWFYRACCPWTKSRWCPIRR